MILFQKSAKIILNFCTFLQYHTPSERTCVFPFSPNEPLSPVPKTKENHPKGHKITQLLLRVSGQWHPIKEHHWDWICGHFDVCFLLDMDMERDLPDSLATFGPGRGKKNRFSLTGRSAQGMFNEKNVWNGHPNNVSEACLLSQLKFIPFELQSKIIV